MKGEFILPAPGIISPGEWEISASADFGGQACSARTDKKMITGLSDNPHDAYLRRHEMAHVAISPDDPVSALKKIPKGKRPSMDSTLACEDARVTAYLRKVLGPDAAHDPEWPTERKVETISKVWKSGDRRRALLFAMCSGISEQALADADLPVLVDYVSSIRRKVGPASYLSGPRGFRWTIQAAKAVDDIFSPPPQEDRRTTPEGREGEGDGGGAHCHKWLVPDIKPLPLSKSLPDKRADVATDMGVEFGDIERLLLDRKVFTRKVPAPRSGSLLIDGSGSMGHSYTRLEDVLKARPEANVGVYSGPDLFIVAKSGRYADPKEWIGRLDGSNASDLPALEWLAKQKAPRTYISDLGVTMTCSGHGECFEPSATEEVLAFCQKHGIEIFSDVETALKAGE